MIRDYTIHLRVSADRPFSADEIDDVVNAAVDASSASIALNEAVSTGLRDLGHTMGRGFNEVMAEGSVENFYVVSNTAPEGAIE